MVYVYEKQRSEYKCSVAEADLNTLGAEGWELVGVVATPETTQFYFKRAVTQSAALSTGDERTLASSPAAA